MFKNSLLIDHRADHVVGDNLDLGDFVGCSKTIEEMKKWNSRFESRSMRDQREVLRFLD